MKCPKCGKENPERLAQCGGCGGQLSRFEDQETHIVPDSGSPTGEFPSGPSSPPFKSSRGALPAPFPPSSSSGSFEQAGLVAGRYEILELIGEGGMGAVYKARDRELDKVVALKVIRSETVSSPGVVQRFKQELLLARQITHKNVIRIHDLGEANGIKFFTMEFIEGENLKQVIRARGKIPHQEALAIARQILSALEEAHRQGVIHRDLKPQNIMIDKEGNACIMDFGIARSTEGGSLTATGAVLGTPDYMSPEQARGEQVNQQCDLYSFGVIFYEMLTGELPFKADTPLTSMMMRLTKRPPAPRTLNADIPNYQEDVVLKCMEIDPALRYREAREILGDLEGEQVRRSLTSVGLRVQRAVVRRKAGLAAMAAVIIAVTAAVYFAVIRPPPGPGGQAAGSGGRGGLVTVSTQPGEPVTTLAVLPLTNATGSEEFEWMRAGLPEMLVTDISQSRYVRPLPSERVSTVLRELGIEQSTRFDEAALDAISERTRADSVLYGQFVEAGGTIRLDLTLREAGSGVPIPLKVEAATSDVFALVDQITRSVKEHLDLTPEQLRGDTDHPIAEVSTASLEARRAFQAGLSQLQQGANQGAIELLERATTEDPNFAMAYAKLAEAHLNTGHQHEAEAAIERARSLSESSPLPLPERYQIHATAALVKDDYETAAQSLSELAKLYPEDPDILLSLARSYEELGHLPDAIDAYQQVLAIAPGYGAALLGLGRVQVTSGSNEEAIDALEEALKTGQFEKDLEATGMTHSILGVAYWRTGGLDKATEHLNLSLEFRQQAGDKRGESTTLFNLASVYESRGEIDEALNAEERALAIAREIGDAGIESAALSSMGLTYRMAGDLDKALQAFRDSMQIEMERKDHAELANRLDNIAAIYRLKGQYDDALIYLEQAKSHLAQTEYKQEEGVNFNNIGLVRRAQGLYEEAVEAFLAALPLYQEIHQEIGVADIHHNLGEIYMSQGRYGDTFTAFQQSLAIYRELHVEHDTAAVEAALAHLLLTLGLLDEAQKGLEGALEVARTAHAEGVMPRIILGQAELARLRDQRGAAAAHYREANTQADNSQQKEVAVECRIAMGQLRLEEGQLADAEQILKTTREEARRARLRPLEARAATILAEVYLANGNAEGARRSAQEAISLAQKFSGRPILYRAYALRGAALEALGRQGESVDSYTKAASTLEWIRGSLLPQHVDSFMAKSEVQTLLKKTVAILEKESRGDDAAPLKKWIR